MWQTQWGRCIYTSPSGYKVYQNLLYRWLTLGSDALQTVLNRYNPKRPVLYYIPTLTMMIPNQPGNICLLGLGGAGVAHLLSSNGYVLRVVDNSSEVIQIASDFFMIDTIKGLSIVQDHAYYYMQNCEEQFDHLLVDLYDAHNFPKECANETFFMHCKKNLTTKGYIAVNLANTFEQLPILNLIKKQFNKTLVIPINNCSNVVIIASNIDDDEFFLNTIRKTRNIKKIVWMEYWGYVGSY